MKIKKRLNLSFKKFIFLFFFLISFIKSYTQIQTKYYENGQLKQIGNYYEGNKDGVWKFYYKNGNLLSFGKYKNGIQIGKWKFYYDNGFISSIRNFDFKGKKKGMWIFYYRKENVVSSKTKYRKDKKIKINNYYRNGNLRNRKIFKNNKLKTKSYYKDGVLKVSGEYLNNKQHNKWIYYHRNGQKSAIGSFVEGYYEGKWLRFYENGIIKEHVFYYDKNKTSFYQKNYKNGNIKILGNNSENQQEDGIWKYYHRNGNIYQIRFWNKGNLINITTCLNENGDKIDKGTIENGIGSVKEYINDTLINNNIIKKKSLGIVKIWENWNNWGALNDFSWRVYKKENNSIELKYPLIWIKRSISLNKNYFNTDTFAALLYKNKMYHKALEVAKEALDIGNALNENTTQTQKLIKEIETKLIYNLNKKAGNKM